VARVFNVQHTPPLPRRCKSPLIVTATVVSHPHQELHAAIQSPGLTYQPTSHSQSGPFPSLVGPQHQYGKSTGATVVKPKTLIYRFCVTASVALRLRDQEFGPYRTLRCWTSTTVPPTSVFALTETFCRPHGQRCITGIFLQGLS
jgi:hypothetical protein